MTDNLDRNKQTNKSGDGFRKLSLSGIARNAPRLKPKPHQQEAIKANVKALLKRGSDVRAQCIMACGTGKTLVAVHSAEAVSDRMLLTEPSLALIRQTLTTWRANTRHKDLDILVVCSDETVAINGDEATIKKEDVPARVTSDPTEIAYFLRDDSRPKLLVSTLHSTPLVAEAMRHPGVKQFGVMVVDEAHRTASSKDSAFALPLEQEAIPSRTRLFLTATPKLFDGDSERERVHSMDDETVYGKRSYNLGFRDAIQRELLTDYQLVVAAITEKEFKAYRERFESDSEFRDGIAQIGFCRCAAKYSISKAMTFLKTVARAKDFAANVKNAWEKFGSKAKLWVDYVSGTMPTARREGVIEIFKEQPKSGLSILSNCRCLGEGVDIPALDCVAFLDPKNSEVDVVQAVGRAMRLSDTKTIGTIFVPVVIPDEQDADKLLNSSEFKKVVQVIRALRAIDDGFEVRISKLAEREGSGGGRGPKDPDAETRLDFDSLPAEFKDKLTTKIIRLGLGLKATPLSIRSVQQAFLLHRQKFGYWATVGCKDPVPGMPNDTWSSIQAAIFSGCRNFPTGHTWSSVTEPVREQYGEINPFTRKPALDLDELKNAFRISRAETGKWPRVDDNHSPVPGLPKERWTSIARAIYRGHRNIPKGMTWSQIIDSLRSEFGERVSAQLTVKNIQVALVKLKKATGKWATANTTDAVPGLPGWKWRGIGRQPGRGLRIGTTLFRIKRSLKSKLGNNLEHLDPNVNINDTTALESYLRKLGL